MEYMDLRDSNHRITDTPFTVELLPQIEGALFTVLVKSYVHMKVFSKTFNEK